MQEAFLNLQSQMIAPHLPCLSLMKHKIFPMHFLPGKREQGNQEESIKVYNALIVHLTLSTGNV